MEASWVRVPSGSCGRRRRTAGVGTAAAAGHGTRNTVPSRAATEGSPASGHRCSSQVRCRTLRTQPTSWSQARAWAPRAAEAVRVP